MNKRLKELAEQAGLEEDPVHGDWSSLNYPDVRGADLERFAELIRADERTSHSKNIDVTDLVLRAKAEEREACAKLCDDLQLTDLSIRDWADGTYDCAKAIRARGEPDPAFKNYMGDNWAGIV